MTTRFHYWVRVATATLSAIKAIVADLKALVVAIKGLI